MSEKIEDPEKDQAYFEWLKKWAEVHSDGCTHALDIHVHCCWQHDYCYQTGRDPREAFKGNDVKISRADSDQLFRVCNESEDPLGRFSAMAWWRWAVVRVLGRFFYGGDKHV